MHRLKARLIANHGLYFVLNPITGYVKIGISSDVRRRVSDLSVASGIWLEIIAAVTRYGLKMERSLHGMFHKDRVIGEWFRPSEGLSGFIAAAEGRVGEWVRANRRAVRDGYLRENERIKARQRGDSLKTSLYTPMRVTLQTGTL